MVVNMTMKSGTNQFHGSGFDYFVNEFLNAGDPFSSNGNGGKERPLNRRNDFGGTLGGPVWIPKIYNGRNRTFFLFNYEEFLETTTYTFTDTAPASAYLSGNFAAISPNGNCSLCSTYGIQTTALGVPTVGIFGPTSPWHWAPLNPLAATIETKSTLDCRPCHKPVCRLGHHRCMHEIGIDEILAAAASALASAAENRPQVHA